MADPINLFRDAIRMALGNAPEVIEPGRLHRFPTNERRGDVAGWCKLFADLRGGVFGCMRQGISEVWTAADRRSMTVAERLALARHIEAATREREQQRRAEWAVNAKHVTSLWAQCMPVSDNDPVHRYLCRRLAIDTFNAPPCLRLHPALDYWHEGKRLSAYPAMVATLTAPNGQIVALHRTWLTPEGRKADVPGKEKKLTCTSGALTGASIRLQKPASGVIGIAEGIETALAASQASGVPTVAGYCGGALAGYQWPAGVQRLVVFADHDPAGREAADKLKLRALRAGLRVNVLAPSEAGADWCDVWAARDAVTVKDAA